MTGKIFIDTNILVYASDKSDPEKQRIAQNLICNIHNGVISTQVMQEFYSVATRKLDIEPLKARQIVKTFERFEIIPTLPSLVLNAIDLHILEQLQFWDALIIAAASNANCTELLSEDLSTGQFINGVLVTNPFLVH
jgi:predicted nucleic acid-binding protein